MTPGAVFVSWSCFCCEKGRISPPGIQLLRELLQGGDIPAALLLAVLQPHICQTFVRRPHFPGEQSRRQPGSHSTKAEREIGLWCSCLKSLSGQFQSKTYVQTKGFILKYILLHERPFCICLAYSGPHYCLWNAFQRLRHCFSSKLNSFLALQFSSVDFCFIFLWKIISLTKERKAL